MGAEQWVRATRDFSPLNVGDQVMIQCQTGRMKGQWNTSGLVVEVLENDSYLIKTDGSGRVTKRRRCYLKPTLPVRDRLIQLSQDRVSVDSSVEDSVAGKRSVGRPRGVRKVPVSTGRAGLRSGGPVSGGDELPSDKIARVVYEAMENGMEKGIDL